jgi:tetratricopeptide (TPR) repeat protein
VIRPGFDRSAINDPPTRSTSGVWVRLNTMMTMRRRFRPCRAGSTAYLIVVAILVVASSSGCCEGWSLYGHNNLPLYRPSSSSSILSKKNAVASTTIATSASCRTRTLLTAAAGQLQDLEQRMEPPPAAPAIHNHGEDRRASMASGRRAFVACSAGTIMCNVLAVATALPVHAEEGTSLSSRTTATATTTSVLVEVSPSSPDVRKLFNEARAYESQGNLLAAQKLYEKVTSIAPRFLYGWSNLGNTQTAFGDLTAAEQSYTTAIDLCDADASSSSSDATAAAAKRSSFSPSPPPSACAPDYYMLRLNRGTLRINNGRPKEGLADLQLSNALRGRPDAVVLQNLALAEEINGLYVEADRDYTTAIQMTANAVVPFWLRSVLVKYQLGDIKAGNDILKRVENRFPQAPEVRAASAVYLWPVNNSDDDDDARTAARQKFLLIPDRARLKYVDQNYVTNTIHWPPAMVRTLREITKAVGDDARTSASSS